MALVYSSNQQPTTSADAFWRLIQLLVSAGWTIVSAGDGTSLVVPASGVTFAQFNNNNAWIFCRMPGSLRGFVFQVISAASNTISISYFGPSSPVTNTPTGSTAPVCSGAPYTTIAISQLIATSTNYVGTLNRVSYWADNTAPYGFGMHGWSTAGSPTFHLVLDGLQTNSYAPSNQDPYVISAMPNGTSSWMFSNNGSNTVTSQSNTVLKSWLKYNVSGGSYLTSGVCIPVHAIAYNGGEINWYSVWGQTSIGAPVSTFDNKDEELPATYFYLPNTGGYIDYGGGGSRTWYGSTVLGVGTYVKIYRQYRAGSYYLNTLSVNSTSDRIVYGNATLPWSGVAPQIP